MFGASTYSQIRVEIGIERAYGYYLTKVLLLLVILVMMSWVVFVFPTDDLSGRSGTTMTLFLAAIAFNFIISATLPKVSYMTKMDIYLLVCYAFIFLSVVQSGIVYTLARYLDLGDVAFNLDKWCLIAFPAFYFLYTLFFCLYIFKKLWHRTFRSTKMNTTLVVSGEKAKQFVAVNDDHVGAEGTIPQPADSTVSISVVDRLQRVEVVVQR